jgi:hypothetical protein
MTRTGRPKAELALLDNERATLQRWARRAKSSQALALVCYARRKESYLGKRLS